MKGQRPETHTRCIREYQKQGNAPPTPDIFLSHSSQMASYPQQADGRPPATSGQQEDRPSTWDHLVEKPHGILLRNCLHYFYSFMARECTFVMYVFFYSIYLLKYFIEMFTNSFMVTAYIVHRSCISPSLGETGSVALCIQIELEGEGIKGRRG